MGFVLFLILLSFGGFSGLTGHAVIVLDDGVTADQISVIAKLASTGDETKMLSEVDVSQGGMLIFSGLDDGSTAKLLKKNGNIYVKGNVKDAVEVLKNENYEALLQENDGVIEIVNGEIIVEKKVAMEEEAVDEEANVADEADVVNAVDNEADVVDEEAVEEQKTTCEKFDWGVRDYASYTTPRDIENYCWENYATVYSCYEGAGVYQSTPVTTTTYCQYGCEKGVCKEPEEGIEYGYTCEDSDNGKELFTKGITKGKDKDGNAVEVEDYCTWGSYGYAFVVEGSCDYSTDTVYYAQYSCEWGCKDGACASSASEQTDSCEQTKDTDGRTTVKGMEKSEPYEYTNACQDEFSFVGYYCDGRTYNTFTQNCQHRCDDGICVGPSCSETVSESGVITVTGIEYGEEYSQTSYCTGNYLLEAYCDEYEWPSSKSIECEYGCADGACKKEGEKIKPGCTDTDGGDVPDIDGEVYGANPAGIAFGPQKDYCFYNSFYKVYQIEEYVCAQQDGVYYAKAVHHDCPGGCTEGVCTVDEVHEVAEEESPVAITEFLESLPSDAVIVIPTGLSTRQMLGAVQLAGKLHLSVMTKDNYVGGPAIILGGNREKKFIIDNDVLIISPGSADMRDAVRDLWR